MMGLESCKVFLSLTPIDMRKSYDGLSALVSSILQQDPLSGHVFVFTNKRQDRLKALYWHLNGFCLWQKRLERGRFHVPKTDCEASMALTLYQLEGLFQGIAWEKVPVPKTLMYRHV